MTKLYEYLSRKIEANKNPEIPFEPDPYAEEGLLVLQLIEEAQEKFRLMKEDFQQMEFKYKAERRNVEFLKEQRKIDLMNSLS